MGEYLKDIPNNYTPQVVTTRMLPRGRILTDSNGAVLTESSEVDNDKVYIIDASAGAGTYYFYSGLSASVDLLETFKLIGFWITVDAAVTLSGILEKKVDGDWKEMPAYQFPYGGGSYTPDEAQQCNDVYPLEQGIYGTPLRIKAVVGGACNIKAQMLEG